LPAPTACKKVCTVSNMYKISSRNGVFGPHGESGWFDWGFGFAGRYNPAGLRVLRAIMALSGFGQSPAAGGKAMANTQGFVI